MCLPSPLRGRMGCECIIFVDIRRIVRADGKLQLQLRASVGCHPDAVRTVAYPPTHVLDTVTLWYYLIREWRDCSIVRCTVDALIERRLNFVHNI